MNPFLPLGVPWQAPALQPPTFRAATTSCRKLTGLALSRPATVTGTLTLCRPALTTRYVVPFPAGRTKPVSSTVAVVGVSLLWVYFRHHDRFADFRNWLIGANLLGLVGYVLMPTAPPRMFPEWGFTDTLADLSGVNQQSVAFAANPYAAMPSLHAMDALIVGLVMASVCRSRVAKILWLVWPAWVSFAVMGTGNHFWLDCVAGFLLAIVTGVILFRGRLRQFVPGL